MIGTQYMMICVAAETPYQPIQRLNTVQVRRFTIQVATT